MADIKEQNIVSPTNGVDVPAPTPAAITPKTPKESKGETFYNWTVYRGINYWINLAGSVAIADYFVNLAGKPKLEKAAGYLAKHIGPAFKLEAEKALETSRNTLAYLALTSGGWILVAPIKLLEDRKRPIVHWLNKKFGTEEKAADGHTLTPKEIHIAKEQPKQSWPRVLGRRALGSIAVLISGNVIDHVWGKDNVTNFVMKGTGGQGGVNKVLRNKSFPGGKWLSTHPRAQAWMEFTVLDSFFTQITATIMQITNGAKKAGEIQEHSLSGDLELFADDSENKKKNGEKMHLSHAPDRSVLKPDKIRPAGSFTELAAQAGNDLSLNP